MYIMLYTILNGFLSWVQKCHLCGHVTSFYCHIWQLSSKWLNLVDLYDVIYHSDWFFEQSSEMSFTWSCEFILLPYMAITIKLAKFLLIYMMLYIILTGFLSWVQKCHIHGHVTSSYCHIWQLPSNWLNLIDIYDVIYYSDQFVELSSEVSSMWSYDCFLLPYEVITIKLAKSY
jgi:hypothetical protein